MNILVVNGSGSIGSALVGVLSGSEERVFYTSNNPDDQALDNCIHWKYSGSDSVDKLFETVKQHVDSVDAVVNCLGSIILKPAHLTTEEELDDTIDINLRSSFFILKKAFPLMRKNGGNILFFSSAAASIGLVNHEAIAAAKGGLEALVRSAAATYAKKNIRVNAVALGLVETSLSSKIVENPISLEMSKKMHSLGRIGTPESVINIAKQLIVDKNSWITGSVVNLDGGLATTKIAS
jgi:NAD(P)-dependent dehydrogenase (short-subunit alcohol dehydrogenase family)|tara:strand:+ start:2301 stop:3011 length:711 start_codon:yes stop_codon:yes gene_type:complete